MKPFTSPRGITYKIQNQHYTPLLICTKISSLSSGCREQLYVIPSNLPWYTYGTLDHTLVTHTYNGSNVTYQTVLLRAMMNIVNNLCSLT